jgi:dihydroorotate dehydrogenase electron transfer subunit
LKHLKATVTQRRTLGAALWEIALYVPDLGGLQAGQACLVATPNYLRRPLFPASMAHECLSTLIKADADPAFAWLISRAPGDGLDLLGPVGRGFASPQRGERWLLAAETAADMDSLRQLIRSAPCVGAEVVLLTGATHAAAVFPLAELPPSVEVRIATGDGSLGVRGSVASLLGEVLPWADHVCAVGSRSLYRALWAAVQAMRPTLARDALQVLVTDVPMMCGVGACLACATAGRHGAHLICQAGPVMALDDALESEAGSV